MAEKTGISWCDHTFNVVMGCMKVSPGCAHCYAEVLARRYGEDVWGPAVNTSRRTFGADYWKQPLKWNANAMKAGERRRVFCSSMADVFEDHPTVIEETAKLWSLIEATPWLDWLLLTKRPERIPLMLPPAWLERSRPNVWLGTSTENQEYADLRIPLLLKVPAAVRFLSAEPLLGSIDLSPWLPRCDHPCDEYMEFAECPCTRRHQHAIDWVIAGGESGLNFRAMEPYWARQLRDQCVDAGVAFFYKQGSSRFPGKEPTLDGLTWHQFPEPRAGAPVQLTLA